MQYLIIDDNTNAAMQLEALLLQASPHKMDEEGETAVFKAVQPYLVRSLLACEHIDVIFMRAALWNPSQFEKVQHMPPVVVLTNSNREKCKQEGEYAIDYILREPFEVPQLRSLLQKIAREKKSATPDFLFLRYNRLLRKIPFSEIAMIEKATTNYVRFFLRNECWFIWGNINSWAAQLPCSSFERVGDKVVLPVAEAAKVYDGVYDFRGRSIKMSYRFKAGMRRSPEICFCGLIFFSCAFS